VALSVSILSPLRRRSLRPLGQEADPSAPRVGNEVDYWSACVLSPARQSLPKRRPKMNRTMAFLITTAAVLLFVIAHPAQGQTVNDTQITLSCNDGHSVAAALDTTTLLELTAEVQALSSDPTGLSCTVDPAATPPPLGRSTTTTRRGTRSHPGFRRRQSRRRHRVTPPRSHSNPISTRHCSPPLTPV